MNDTVTLEAAFLSAVMQAIYEMREAQKEYFAGKSEYRLKVAKAKEAVADNYIAQAKAQGWIREKKQNLPTSGKLFV